MLDELDRLRSDPRLCDLLAHYACPVSADPDAWQDRRMALAGAETHDLSRLHGELIAFDWLEQRTGQFGEPRAGAVTACYRVTAAGRRALQQVRPLDKVVEEELATGLDEPANGVSVEAGDDPALAIEPGKHAVFTESDTGPPTMEADAA